VNAAISEAIARALGGEVTGARSIGGGDINDAYDVALADGRHVFVKTNHRAPPTMFAAEARGLAWLAEPDILRIPKVLAVGDELLVLELIRPGRPSAHFDEILGHGLARLHRSGAAGFGLDHDNFIGRLPQVNTPCDDWAEFYGSRRLEPQLRAAVDAKVIGGALHRRLDQVIGKLEQLVGPPEPPARLHGDLWAGNKHVDERGQPCLIDPAAYGGHREVDLAMMQLFGGFGERVFAAYHEVYPLAPDWRARTPLYQLYPLLVHVNLFGSGYVGQLERALGSLRA